MKCILKNQPELESLLQGLRGGNGHQNTEKPFGQNRIMKFYSLKRLDFVMIRRFIYKQLSSYL